MKLQVLAFILLTVIAISYAEDLVAVNSQDGRDVLSGIFYANAKGVPVKFLPSQGGDADIFAAKAGSGHSVLLIQSDKPVSTFVEQALKAKNNTVEVFASSNGGATNLELAKRSGAASFIVVDSAYSDSAITVLPYAARTKSYVILASKDNIAEVMEVVQGKKVMIFGLVDSEVSGNLSALSPEMVGKGEDKYEDNVLMAERMMSEFGMTSVIMVDGSFIEESMLNGDRPLLLSGRLVPKPTYDFIKGRVSQGKLVQIMLIGNDMIVPAYDMRTRIVSELASEGKNATFGIMVKFAQVVPAAGTGVIILDTFRMPAYRPQLAVGEVAYNAPSGRVMVTVDNTGEGAAYYALELRVKVNGADYKIFQGSGTSLVERGEKAGSEYPLDLAAVPEGNVTALVIVKYGASKKSMEEVAEYEGPLTTITYVDKSNVTVQFAKYDREKKTMAVTLRNNGAEKAYAMTKLGLVLGGSPANISAPATRELAPGSLAVEEFPLELSEAELASNRNVDVFIDYGGRPGFLGRHAQYIVALEAASVDQSLAIIAVAALFVALIAAYMFMRRQKGAPETKGQPQKKKG